MRLSPPQVHAAVHNSGANAQTASGPNRVDVIEGYSQVELRELPLHSFHIIYIDGDHVARAVLEDAVLSWRLLKVGGLIIFDDYAWEHQREPPFRPLMAIDFFTEVFRGTSRSPPPRLPGHPEEDSGMTGLTPDTRSVWCPTATVSLTLRTALSRRRLRLRWHLGPPE